MRDELMDKILNLMTVYGIPVEEVKSKLFLIMNPYEITARTTEVAVVNDESADKYINLFLLNKRVAGRTERTLRQYNDTLRKDVIVDCLPEPVPQEDNLKIYGTPPSRNPTLTATDGMRILGCG